MTFQVLVKFSKFSYFFWKKLTCEPDHHISLLTIFVFSVCMHQKYIKKAWGHRRRAIGFYYSVINFCSFFHVSFFKKLFSLNGIIDLTSLTIISILLIIYMLLMNFCCRRNHWPLGYTNCVIFQTYIVGDLGYALQT